MFRTVFTHYSDSKADNSVKHVKCVAVSSSFFSE